MRNLDPNSEDFDLFSQNVSRLFHKTFDTKVSKSNEIGSNRYGSELVVFSESLSDGSGIPFDITRYV